MQIEHSIRIEAPPDVVWEVSTDVERWPEWNPNVDSITRVGDGAFDVGSAARIRQPGLPEAKWTVTESQPGERFTWETRIRGMRMIATHELSASGEGTENTLRLQVSGLPARLLWPLLRLALRRALQRENAGLQRECETRTGS